MRVTANYLRNACQALVIELTNLQQLKKPLTIDEFFDLSEGGVFVQSLMQRYGSHTLSLGYLNYDDENADGETGLLSYIEEAFSRHSNVVTRDDFGVIDDAYLLAINVTVAISREADDMQ